MKDEIQLVEILESDYSVYMLQRHRMIRLGIFYVLASTLLFAGCGLPGAVIPPASTQPPTEAALGTKGNPIVLAARPGSTREALDAAAKAAERLSNLTGLTIVAAPAESYTKLVEAMGAGTIQAAFLPPLAYLLAHEKGYADAALVTVVAGQERAASEFIVNAARLVSDNGFKVYFDAASGVNMVDVSTALAQFGDMKPCWTDAYSTAGYVLPMEILTQAGVPTKAGAFLQGEDTVVNAIYRDTTGTLCDFGAVTVDSRTLLTAHHPDVDSKVRVVWRTDAVIPNDGIAYAKNLPDDFRVHITAAFLAMAGSESDLALLRSAYHVEGLKLIDDSFYNDLRRYVGAADVNLPEFIR